MIPPAADQGRGSANQKKIKTHIGHEPVFFLRGLCTYCDDNLHLGPLVIGPMAGPIGRSFARDGFQFFSVNNMKCGDLEELGQRALTAILQTPSNFTSGGVHLLGHSLGGLVARWVASHLTDIQVKSITTIATPHQGSQLAEFLANVKSTHPLLYKAAKWVGYPTDSKQKYYSVLHRQAVAKFNQSYPLPSEISRYSIVCALPSPDQSLPLRVLQKAFPLTEANDGMVELKSQVWGQPLATLRLDHFSQLGYHLYPTKRRRQIQHQEFERMLTTLKEIYHPLQT